MDRPWIVGADAHHLRDVLRVRPGGRITVFDGTGTDFRAEIVDVTADGVRVALTAPLPVRRESPLRLTVAQAYLKDKKMDMLVRHLTELGITRWLPFPARRSVALPDAKRLESRRRRWVKISQEAVKQCGRSRAMVIAPLASFDDALAKARDSQLRFIFWENVSAALPMAHYDRRQPADLFLMVGPEGGFEPGEIDRALDRGFHAVSMGPRILRSETASLAAGILAQALFGDLNQKILDNEGGGLIDS